MKKFKFQLDRDELDYGSFGSNSSGRKNLRRLRQLDVRGELIYMTYLPTNIKVEMTIPDDHYSKTDLQKLRKNAYESLYEELTVKVKRRLKIK